MLGKRLEIGNKVARKLWSKYHPEQRDPIMKPDDEWHVCLGSYRKTKVFCDNPFCCGNPRKLGRLTRQEIRAAKIEDEW